jgi:hypothetical protein
MVTARVLALVAAQLVAQLAVAPAAAAEPVREAPAPAAPVMVAVVNAGVPVDGVSLAALRGLLLGNQRFWGGTLRVEVIVEAGPTPARRMYVEQLLGMSEIQFQQYWIGQVFRGRATHAPRAVPGRDTALALLAALPGALAIVEDGPLPPGVRALPIDGRLPGAPGYPLVGAAR